MLMLPDGVGPALADPGVGKKTVRSVTWNRLGPQVTNYTITYSNAPVTGSGGKFPYGYCTWWVAHRRYVPWNGDAWQWWYNAQQFHFAEGQVPDAGAVLGHARQNLEEFIRKGLLVRDTEAAIYLYRLASGEQSQHCGFAFAECGFTFLRKDFRNRAAR